MRYAAALSVDPGAEGFSGEISIDLQLSRRTRLLWLHARRLDVDRAELSAGGAVLPAEVRPGGKEHLGFQLPSAVGPGPARL
ncbi:MAG TPA: hypothetical protein VND93_15770, partial [Myxococcales bacterium]|nr:hypothetical protein [Myxococcales bacterium]